MSVEIADIRAGLVTNLKTVADARQVSAYRLSNPTPPALIVVGFDQIEAISFGRGSYDMPFTIQGLAGKPTERSAQVRLDKWLSPLGTMNVWTAIESDKTLGGKVEDVIVTLCDGAQIIETSPGVEVLGSTWHVQITL